MSSSATLSRSPVGTPDLVRRLGLIMAGLAAVVAARFLRMPAMVGLTVLLWRRLTHAAPRVARAMAGPVRVRPSRAGLARAKRVMGLRLPAGRGWLVRVLGHEAVAYRSQLEALLADPEMRAALEAAPGVGRVLRPLCRMLGLPVALATAVAERPVRPERPWPPVAKAVLPAESLPWQDFVAGG